MTGLGCPGDDEPVATYGDHEITADEIVAELDFLLEDGQTMADLQLTPDAFLRRVVQMRMLVEAAKRRVPALSEGDDARLALYRETLYKEALLDTRYPEPPVFDEATLRARHEETYAEKPTLLHFRGDETATAAMQAALARGESFTDAARALAETDSTIVAQSLGGIGVGELPPTLEQAALSLPVGSTSDPVRASDGTHLFHCVSREREPFQSVRDDIVAALRVDVRRSQMADLESELLLQGMFRPDSSTIGFLADRIAGHRDSLEASGLQSSRMRLPRLSEEDRRRTFFDVLGRSFTAAELWAELGGVEQSALKKGQEIDQLHVLARRRALSAIVQEVAAQRGLVQRPDIVERVERKRDEFFTNTLLRELWRGLEPTPEEVAAEMERQGMEVPGEAGLRRIVDQTTRQRQGARLDQFLQQLEVQENVRYYPERLPDLGAIVGQPSTPAQL